jgi:hypothetical protein
MMIVVFFDGITCIEALQLQAFISDIERTGTFFTYRGYGHELKGSAATGAFEVSIFVIGILNGGADTSEIMIWSGCCEHSRDRTSGQRQSNRLIGSSPGGRLFARLAGQNGYFSSL